MPDVNTDVDSDVHSDVDTNVDTDVDTDVDESQVKLQSAEVQASGVQTEVQAEVQASEVQTEVQASEVQTKVQAEVHDQDQPSEVQTEETMTKDDWMNRVIQRWRRHLPLRVRFGNVTPQTLADGFHGPGPAGLSGVLFDIREKTIMAPFELIACVAVLNPFDFEKLSFQYDASADALEVLPQAEHRLVVG